MAERHATEHIKLTFIATHPALSAFAQQQQAILKAVTEEEKALKEKWD
jgi:hypothetical protein